MNYEQQTSWQEIQSFLPDEMHFTSEYSPTEEWWPWNGHRLHLDRFRNPSAKVKLIQFHGVGTNGRQISMIVGGPLWKRGYETVAIDMPGYGMTEVARGSAVSYADWVQAAGDFIDAELAADPRPIVLYGLSAGGMLTYHAAAINKRVRGIIGMCFLNQREQQVIDETAYNLLISRVGVPLVHLTAKTSLAGLKMPMRFAGKMHTLVNDEEMLRICLRDKTSAGAWVSMKFLSDYLSYRPAVEPEDFTVCPILLTQPANDRWTPLHLSQPFLDRCKNVTTKIVVLDGAGHYPVEQPGLQQMIDAIDAFASTI